jgi:hypothetical protein
VNDADRAAALVHDVGKYIARIASNVKAGDVPPALVPLLARDLYELPSGGRASERFAALSVGLEKNEYLQTAKKHLATIDRLEPGVRAGEPEACKDACVLALNVAAVLRAYADEVRGQ